MVAHSHGGYIALKAAALRPELVKNMVLVESSGFLAQDELPALRDTAFLFLYGDNLDATPLWQSLMKQAAAFRQGLEKAGARVRWDEIPQRGVYGNSHMLMMDNNSDAIADSICEWLLA